MAWAFKGEQPLTVTGRGMIDVSLWAQNGLDDGASGESDESHDDERAGARLVPSPPQKVRIRLPKGKTAKDVKFLVGAAAPHFREWAGTVEVDVPPIELHQAIAIDLT